MSNFVFAIRDQIDRSYRQMAPITGVLEGALSVEEIRRFAIRQYAEVRCFLDLKLPERMRLCPSDAMAAKSFLAMEYREEHGGFRPECDHGTLWARFCAALGVEMSAMDEEYRRLLPRYAYMRTLEPSLEVMVKELAVMAGWESIAPRCAEQIVDALRRRYDIPLTASAVEFWSLHRQVDAAHSIVAVRTLAEYATTPVLQDMALRTIADALNLTHYFD